MFTAINGNILIDQFIDNDNEDTESATTIDDQITGVDTHTSRAISDHIAGVGAFTNEEEDDCE